MTNGKNSLRSSVEERLAAIAQNDPGFRQELIANPNATLAKMFGTDLPSGVKVQVHQEDDNTVHIVLPAMKESAVSSADTTYCNQGGASWSSCGYELSCYGPTCC